MFTSLQKPASIKLFGKLTLWSMHGINGTERVLRSLGLRLGNIDTDVIIQKAMQEAGVSKIIDDSFQEPLEVLIHSANQNPNLRLTGRLSFKDDLLRRVSNRLQIDATLQAYPDILEQPIEQPIFIAALPRTGTTLLHRLFAQDEHLRVPLEWEMDYPCPPPEQATYASDPRIRLVEKKYALIHAIVPQFKAIHEAGAQLPEECICLFANDLMGDYFNVAYELPEYEEWFKQQDLRPLYARHKKQLQLLQYCYRKSRWALKAPSHMRGLDALAQTYPDAYIIQTHRDPAEILASTASLITLVWSLQQYKVRPEHVGQAVLELLEMFIQKSMKDREQIEADPASKVRFIDVAYKDLVHNPVETLRELYAQCELEWSAIIEQQIQIYLNENRQHKHGKHHYSLEQFGLQAARVNERFAAYNQRFN